MNIQEWKAFAGGLKSGSISLKGAPVAALAGLGIEALYIAFGDGGPCDSEEKVLIWAESEGLVTRPSLTTFVLTDEGRRVLSTPGATLEQWPRL